MEPSTPAKPAPASSSGSTPARRDARNNWNPFSTKPGLDFAAFVTTVVMVAAVEFGFGYAVQVPLATAKAHVDHKQIALFYVAWVLVSLIGFFFIANSFMKRWATVYRLPACPWWMKSVSRLLLLSPLFSIWATLFTLMYSEEGWLFKDGERRSAIVVKALATFFVFHVAYLGYRLAANEVSFKSGVFLLRSEVSARGSLPPGIVRSMWLPGDAFYVHAYPYLSPLTKLGVSIYTDFGRSKMLADQVSVCDSSYLGEKVPNCYLEMYREVALKRPFVTPAFAVIFESLYRQSVMKTAKPSLPMEAFGLNAISVENLVYLLEPGDMVYDRKKFLKPVGLLPFYGSPELPAISVGQDAQKLLLGAKFVPLLEPQLKNLGKALDSMKGAVSPEQQRTGDAKLESLEARLHALAADPLATSH